MAWFGIPLLFGQAGEAGASLPGQDGGDSWVAGVMASFAPIALAASLASVATAVDAGAVGRQPQDDLPLQVVSTGAQSQRVLVRPSDAVNVPAPWRWHQETLPVPPAVGDEGEYQPPLPAPDPPLSVVLYPQDELGAQPFGLDDTAGPQLITVGTPFRADYSRPGGGYGAASAPLAVDEGAYHPPLPDPASALGAPLYPQDELASLRLDEGEYQPPLPVSPVVPALVLPPDDLPPQVAPFGLEDGGIGPRFVSVGTPYRVSYPGGGASGSPPSAPFGLADDSGAYLALAFGFAARDTEPTLHLDASEALPLQLEHGDWAPPVPAPVPAVTLAWWTFDRSVLPIAPTPFGLSEDAYWPPVPTARVSRSPVPDQVDEYPTQPTPFGIDEGHYLASAQDVGVVRVELWDDGALPIAPPALDEGAWFPGQPATLAVTALPAWATDDWVPPPTPFWTDEGEYLPPLFLVPPVIQPIWLSFDGAEPGGLTVLLALTAYDFSGARYLVAHYSGGRYVLADHSHPALEVT